jgi:hypothetical protein
MSPLIMKLLVLSLMALLVTPAWAKKPLPTPLPVELAPPYPPAGGRSMSRDRTCRRDR